MRTTFTMAEIRGAMERVQRSVAKMEASNILKAGAERQVQWTFSEFHKELAGGLSPEMVKAHNITEEDSNG